MLERLRRIRWKDQIRFYGILTGVCLILAAGINLYMDQGRQNSEESVSLRRLKSELEAYRRDHGEKPKREELVRIWKSYEGKVSPEEIEELRRDFRARLDPAEGERLEKAYEDMKGKKP
jgi:type II secretory pathway pseudopilin PulG